MNTYSDAVPPRQTLHPRHTRVCTGDSRRATSEVFPMRAVAAGRAGGLALLMQRLTRPSWASPMPLRHTRGMLSSCHGRPRWPSRTCRLSRQKLVDEHRPVIAIIVISHLLPAEQRRASRGFVGKPLVQWACQGWTLGGRDGQGWTPGCRLTTRARKLKVVAAAQQSYPQRLWQSGAPATGMCASLSTLCTKRSRVTFRARHVSSSGQLHASRAYSCCSGLVGVGMGKGWAPWGRSSGRAFVRERAPEAGTFVSKVTPVKR